MTDRQGPSLGIVETQRTRVLYIVGGGRSGSTLLGNILGSTDIFVSVGELHEIWQRGFLENPPCGCGAMFLDCPFWAEVRERLDAAHGPVDVEAVRAAQLAAVRMRKVPRLALTSRPKVGSALERYVAVMGSLYDAIYDTAGGAIVVDSSKYAAGAQALRLTPRVDARFLHLVRDPRAVAWSWRRRKIRDDVLDANEMDRFGPAASTAKWLAANLGAELSARTGRYARLLYEDFAADPATSLSRTLGRLAISEMSLIDGGTVELTTCHTVHGNPDRTRTGIVEVRLDDEWRRCLPKRARMIVIIVGGALMLRYGYVRSGR